MNDTKETPMTCDKHDYRAVVLESVTTVTSEGWRNITTTRHIYELFCQACGDKQPPKE